MDSPRLAAVHIAVLMFRLGRAIRPLPATRLAFTLTGNHHHGGSS
jgi:hypothetical protein